MLEKNFIYSKEIPVFREREFCFSPAGNDFDEGKNQILKGEYGGLIGECGGLIGENGGLIGENDILQLQMRFFACFCGFCNLPPFPSYRLFIKN